MKNFFTKISLFIWLAIILSSCDATKRIAANDALLTRNTIYVNGEKTDDKRAYNFLYQKPNTKPLLQLHFYNLARPNIDSILNEQRIASVNKNNFWTRLLSRKQVEAFRRFKKDFNTGLKNIGEPPAVISDIISEKSAQRLASYYINNGYFNTKITYEIKKDSNQRATVDYKAVLEEPYCLDTITPDIASPVADSIYHAHLSESFLKAGDSYHTLNINRETQRLESLFRNNGMYHFETDRIRLIADTVKTGRKANIDFIIDDRTEVINDTVRTFPFKVHKISEVNIITDYNFTKRELTFKDTLTISEGYTLLAYNKINYKSKALTDILSVKPGDIYSDLSRTRTLTRLSRLNTFKYPSIQYVEDPKDSTRTDLIASIRLTPLEKYKFRADFDTSTSNIQNIGISGFGSLLIRNIFKGAETLEISGRGSIGASDDIANNDDGFFNLSETGADLNLTFPRIFFPVNTRTLIPADWQPNTRFNLGISAQRNIGLDKQNVTGRLGYSWKTSRSSSYSFDILDAQYVRNLNPSNYFNIYINSYQDLNNIAKGNSSNINPEFFETNTNGEIQLSIPNGTQNFINDFENGAISGFSKDQIDNINAIAERQERLVEDNLILSLNFSYVYNNRENIFDNTFFRLATRLELAGNALSLFADVTDAPINESGDSSLFGVIYSQYAKTEIDYTKHWDIGNNNVFALRAFGGIAIPYGNSNNIPFIRSFFAGGSNDNRAWQAYDLGPGSSGSPDEFNEANMKLAFNAEYRFNLLGPFKGAIFTDAGNIWNVLDNVEDRGATFSGLTSLGELGLGSGFGLRVDFDFFILRFDTGFKTYNPALSQGNRWLKEYNFANAVYNIGINYPF